MSDAREALVALIAGSECDWRDATPESIAAAILAAGWTPPGERCEHGGELRWKFDGGRGAVLCEKCRRIVGYLPAKPEKEVRDEW